MNTQKRILLEPKKLLGFHQTKASANGAQAIKKTLKSMVGTKAPPPPPPIAA
jgi:hypothetical protein